MYTLAQMRIFGEVRRLSILDSPHGSCVGRFHGSCYFCSARLARPLEPVVVAECKELTINIRENKASREKSVRIRESYTIDRHRTDQ